jgi:hypothetical protein
VYGLLARVQRPANAVGSLQSDYNGKNQKAQMRPFPQVLAWTGDKETECFSPKSRFLSTK